LIISHPGLDRAGPMHCGTIDDQVDLADQSGVKPLTTTKAPEFVKEVPLCAFG
jgi:hypothetical protein